MIHGKRWLALGFVALAGCGEPPYVVDMGPPGSGSKDVLPKVAKDQTASSLGETGVAPARKIDEAADVPLLEPTEIGVEQTLESGLKYTTLKAGAPNGRVATGGRLVKVHYEGKLDDGTVFDGSRGRNMVFPFTLGARAVIKGWDQGVAGMRVGEVRKLVIPPDLAYGSRDKEGIPANSTLTFEVELMDVN